jgi:hypothetical protein
VQPPQAGVQYRRASSTAFHERLSDGLVRTACCEAREPTCYRTSTISWANLPTPCTGITYSTLAPTHENECFPVCCRTHNSGVLSCRAHRARAPGLQNALLRVDLHLNVSCTADCHGHGAACDTWYGSLALRRSVALRGNYGATFHRLQPLSRPMCGSIEMIVASPRVHPLLPPSTRGCSVRQFCSLLSSPGVIGIWALPKAHIHSESAMMDAALATHFHARCHGACTSHSMPADHGSHGPAGATGMVLPRPQVSHTRIPPTTHGCCTRSS